MLEPWADVNDEVSLAQGNTDGVSWCGPRDYDLNLIEIGRFVTQESTDVDTERLVVGDGPLQMNFNTMAFMLETSSQADVARYEYELVVDLADYKTPVPIDEKGKFQFYVFVI